MKVSLNSELIKCLSWLFAGKNEQCWTHIKKGANWSQHGLKIGHLNSAKVYHFRTTLTSKSSFFVRYTNSENLSNYSQKMGNLPFGASKSDVTFIWWILCRTFWFKQLTSKKIFKSVKYYVFCIFLISSKIIQYRKWI